MGSLDTITPANAQEWIRKYGGIVSTPVSEVPSGIKLIIYGPGGIGKTTLLGTAMDTDLGWPALHLNARGNPHVIRRYGDRMQVIDVTDPALQLQAIRKDLLSDFMAGTMPFKTVFLDGLTEMVALDYRKRYGVMTEVDWQKHSATTATILSVLREWSDLADFGPRLNVFFTAGDVPETRTIRGQEKSRSEMAMNKALQFQAPLVVNWVGRLYIMEGPPRFTRMLDFTPDEAVHQAKHQIDPEDPLTKQIPMEIYNPSLASIIDTVKGGAPWPSAKHQRPGSTRNANAQT